MASVADDRAFVLANFQTLYGRPPTEYEINHVVQAFQNGSYTHERWIAESQPGGDATATVTRIYTEVVGKAPTDPAGVKYYADRLAAGQITQEQMRAEMSATTAKNRAAMGQTTSPNLNDDQANKENAKAYLDDTLHSFGLDGLSDWAWTEIQNGSSNERIIQDLRKTDQYKQRFLGMGIRASHGLPAISEAEYIGYESAAQQAMRAAGLPADFYDKPEDFAKWIGENVSISELQSRINDGYLAASSASAQIKAQLQALYGVGQSQLAAFFLDPDKALPLIQRDWQAAQISGSAVTAGYGALNQTEAERLAALGVTAQQAQQGFSTLQDSQQLFNALPGEVGGGITRDEQQAAIFGNDANARAKILKTGEERVSAGSGASAFAVGNQGVTSLSQELRR